MSNPSPAVGAAAPSFEALPVVGAEGETLSSAMLDGQRYVLYFYPKDDTPGCTTQACDFRDQGAAFEALGYKIFGVSPDSVKRHVNFREKYGLPFPLVSDPEHLLAERFGGMAREKELRTRLHGDRPLNLRDRRGGRSPSLPRECPREGPCRAPLGLALGKVSPQ